MNDFDAEICKILVEGFGLQVEKCQACHNGWLKKPCIVCRGTGKIDQSTCNRCRGTGIYIFKPTKRFDGKKCFQCNGTGKRLK